MITILTSPPSLLTKEELNELSLSTPASFNNIPHLLRLTSKNTISYLNPKLPNLQLPTRTDLYLTEGALSLYSPITKSGLSIPYPHITLHAISRTPMRPFSSSSSTSSATTTTTTTTTTEGEEEMQGGGPCIYCQIDEEEGAENEDGTSITRELIIVPNDPTTLDLIFETLSTCASLHPPTSATGGLGGGGGGSMMEGGGSMMEGGGLPSFFDTSSMIYADADGNPTGPGMSNGGGGGGMDIEMMTEEEERNEAREVGKAAMAHSDFITGKGNQ